MAAHSADLADSADSAGSAGSGSSAVPSRGLAVVTCMDARIDPLSLLGLSLGEAHVLRNAGGVVTDDVLRGLVLSQHLLGTRDVTLVHHTQCGIERLDVVRVAAELEELGGGPPPFELVSFDDPSESVRRSAERLRRDPFLRIGHLEGYVYDVVTTDLVPVRL